VIAITVWLLAIASNVQGGHVVAVQPQMYPTNADCLQVARNLPSTRGDRPVRDGYTSYRCIQTNVLVTKP
jgi:hypothetical protein